MDDEDSCYDVVVVGSGAGGMVAALTAHHHGLRAVVVEKEATYGGSSALSGGNLWIPRNPVNRRAGVRDSLDDARRYLDAVVGDASTPQRREAFLRVGPEMIAFLEEQTSCVRYQRVPGYSDYHPEEPGGRSEGRSIEPVPIDIRVLGREAETLCRYDMMRPPGGLWVTTAEYRDLMLVARTWRGKTAAVRIALRSWLGRLVGRRMVALGAAGSARLRLALSEAGVPVLLSTPMRDLVVEDGRVQGVVVTSHGRDCTLRATRGVVLSCGGFEHNAELRTRYQQAPITTEWTSGAAGNTGDAITVGRRHGAAIDLMERAWWGPALLTSEGAYFMLSERGLPGSLMVNSAAQRFVNEASPYVNAVDAMYAGERSGVSHVPSFLVFDQRFRNRYALMTTPPRVPLPKRWRRDRTVVVAPDLATLARGLGLDAAALEQTVKRFNGFARAGRDRDFGRGDSAYDRYYGDPTVQPNPNLAPLNRPPFYGMRVVPGDLGTSGGLVTDELARVLDDDGNPIVGLYGTGNCTAAVMGRDYAGPGATIGPAMTFGFIAARHLADTSYTPVRPASATT